MTRTNYSGSKCSNCKNTSFETTEETPNNSAFILSFVRCASCKTVVGVLESHNVNYELKIISEKVNRLLNLR